MVPLLNPLDAGILRPPCLIYAVCPSPDIEPELHLLAGELQYRSHDTHRLAQRLCKILGKELSFKELVGAALLDCPKNPRQEVLHGMMVPEDGRAVTLPDVLPYLSRIHATAVDEPLGVVVQSDLCLSVSRF